MTPTMTRNDEGLPVAVFRHGQAVATVCDVWLDIATGPAADHLIATLDKGGEMGITGRCRRPHGADLLRCIRAAVRWAASQPNRGYLLGAAMDEELLQSYGRIAARIGGRIQWSEAMDEFVAYVPLNGDLS